MTHRAFVLAALSDEPCVVLHPLESQDTSATLAGLHAMGARWRREPGSIRFEPVPLRPGHAGVPCGESATTLRLLAAQAARFPHATLLSKDGSLRGRDQTALISALRPFGATAESSRAAVRVQGPLRPASAVLDGPSSQPVSGLLLALAMVEGGSTLQVAEPMASRPYLDITKSVATAFGVRYDETRTPKATHFSIPGGQRPRSSRYEVEGDWSSAAFLFAAAAVTGGQVRVTGLDPKSPQGDRAIVPLLQRFGATTDAAACTVEGGALHAAGMIDVGATPDLFPVLAAVAACAPGTTMLVGGASLRTKESDRIAAMARGLTAMGIQVRERADGLAVTGGQPVGARLPAAADHRIHMALCVAALGARGPSVIEDGDLVRKSWPEFHAAVSGLGVGLEIA